MEYRFENKIHMTPGLMVEVMWTQMKWMKIMLRIAAVLVVTFGALGLILSVVNGGLMTHILVPVIIAALLLYLCWNMPVSTVRGVVKELARHNGGKLPVSVTTFGDTIVTTTMDQSVEYGYDRIQNVLSLKSCYLLVVGKRETLPIAREGFSLGDFESFKAFLAEKRPDLKIPE